MNVSRYTLYMIDFIDFKSLCGIGGGWFHGGDLQLHDGPGGFSNWWFSSGLGNTTNGCGPNMDPQEILFDPTKPTKTSFLNLSLWIIECDACANWKGFVDGAS